MRQNVHRFLLLSKRLFKQSGYIAILLLVPVMIFMLREVSGEKSQLATIGVYKEKGNDKVSDELFRELITTDGLITYKEFSDRDELYDAVAKNLIEEGWIIPDGLSDTLKQVVEKGYTDYPIRIVYGEEGVSHYLLRELLNSRVYKYLSAYVLEAFVTENYGEIQISEPDELMEIMGSKLEHSNFFVMGYADGTQETESVNIALMPVRGILAVWLFICGFAATLFYMIDEKNGLFTWFDDIPGIIRDMLYYIVVMLPAAIVFLLGIVVSGLYTGLRHELPGLALYILSICLFCNIIRRVFNSIEKIGISIPIFTLITVVLSPVFVDVKSAGVIRLLVPSYYYLHGIHDFSFNLKFLIYIVVLSVSLLCFYLSRGTIIRRQYSQASIEVKKRVDTVRD